MKFKFGTSRGTTLYTGYTHTQTHTREERAHVHVRVRIQDASKYSQALLRAENLTRLQSLNIENPGIPASEKLQATVHHRAWFFTRLFNLLSRRIFNRWHSYREQFCTDSCEITRVVERIFAEKRDIKNSNSTRAFWDILWRAGGESRNVRESWMEQQKRRREREGGEGGKGCIVVFTTTDLPVKLFPLVGKHTRE